MAVNLKMKNIPVYLKIIILVVSFLLPAILFYFLVYTPQTDEIKVLDRSISKLDNEIASAEVKVRRLDELRAENERLKQRLAELKEQLPEEKEVTILLKQISDLGLDSGLGIILWKPEARRADPSGIYIEIPVSMEVIGGYHNLGVFFSHISRIKRIVNVSNIKMSGFGRKAGRGLINAAFTASTFSSVKEPGGAAK